MVRGHVYTPEQRGHGRTRDIPGPLTYEQMVDDTVRFLDNVIREPVRLLGVIDAPSSRSPWRCAAPI